MLSIATAADKRSIMLAKKPDGPCVAVVVVVVVVRGAELVFVGITPEAAAGAR